MVIEDPQIPGPQTGYTDLLDHIITKDPVKFEAHPLRPSAAGQCSRKLAYDLMEYEGKAEYEPEERDAPTHRLLDLGHPIEHHVIRYFRKLAAESDKVKIRYQQQLVELFRLPSGRIVEGSNDFAVDWGGEVGIGDVKSSKNNWSSWYKDKWGETLAKLDELESTEKLSDTAYWVEDLDKFVDEVNDPFLADNFWQLNAYCCSPFFKRHNVTHGFIYKYNKNDSRHYEIRFKPSQTMYKRLYKKYKAIDEAIIKHGDVERVPKDYALGSVRCAFCRYQKECHGEKNALKEYFKTWPKRRWPADLSKLNDTELAGMFTQWESEIAHEKSASKLHEELVHRLTQLKVQKVRLDNGNIYELKSYKTGGIANGPRIALKRSKL